MEATTFEFSFVENGYLDEKGDHIERNELVEIFEWWLRVNDKHFTGGEKFVLQEQHGRGPKRKKPPEGG